MKQRHFHDAQTLRQHNLGNNRFMTVSNKEHPYISRHGSLRKYKHKRVTSHIPKVMINFADH